MCDRVLGFAAAEMIVEGGKEARARDAVKVCCANLGSVPVNGEEQFSPAKALKNKGFRAP